MIGTGTFGDVYKGTYKVQGELKEVAIKIYKRKDSNEKDFKRETSALIFTNHDNIIRFYGIWEIDAETSEWSIVMEYANLGNLDEHIKNLTFSQASKVCLDMYHGLQFMHRMGYIHRDLKPANILLFGDLKILNSVRAKLADFGLSRKLTPRTKMTAGCGTYYYMAPEVAKNGGDYDYKVDVYSSTIITFEVFTNLPIPFPDRDSSLKLEAVTMSNKPQIPSYIPKKLKTLIEKGWSKKPQARLAKVDDFIKVIENLTMEDFQIAMQNQAERIGEDILSESMANQWNQDLEEGNSRELRTKMVDDIKKNYGPVAKFLPRVLTAIQNVPKHPFMDVDKTPGSIRSQKIERIYTWNNFMKVVGNTYVEESGFLGLQLSMLEIDVGMDVLVVGASGYIESLVSQLVGPQGKVTVVDTSESRIDTFSTMLIQIAPQQQQNITYRHVDNYETYAMQDLAVYFVFFPPLFKLELKLLGTSTALHICSCSFNKLGKNCISSIR